MHGGHDIGNGLYHYGHRYYQPSTARWAQQAPLMQPADLGQANRYLYVGGDSVNAVDPSGLISLSGILPDTKDIPGIGCGLSIYEYATSPVEGFPESEERVRSESGKVLRTAVDCVPGGHRVRKALEG